MMLMMCVPKPHYGCPASAQFDIGSRLSGKKAWQFRALLTPTLMSHADIDAVHRHMHFILYTLPSLVIIVDQVTVRPQVKPILLPALQNSTLGVEG